MIQSTLNFEAPRAQDAARMGAAGMAMAAQHAGAVEPGFSERAYRFLCWYARLDGAPFSSEAVTELARETGIEPPDGRAWGAVFVRAAKAGVIKRSTETYQRARGHGSLGVKWVAVG